MRTLAAGLSHLYYTGVVLVLDLQMILAPRRSEVEAVAKPGRARVRVVSQNLAVFYLFFY
jgi:hypothetical protein